MDTPVEGIVMEVGMVKHILVVVVAVAVTLSSYGCDVVMKEGCSTDADCADGETCNRDTGRCEPETSDVCDSLACSSPTPYCDEILGRCVECLDDNHCSPGEFCDTTTGTCYPESGCWSDADCGPPTPICDLSTGSCYGCTTAGCPDGLICVAETGYCVGECMDDNDCLVGERCNTATGRCEVVPGCTTDADCDPPRPFCKLNLGVCVECMTNADCNNPTPVCVGGVCEGCLANADCRPGEICNLTTGACEVDGGCTSNADCPDPNYPYCETSTGQCVADLCETMTCGPGQACDPMDGNCKVRQTGDLAGTFTGPVMDVNSPNPATGTADITGSFAGQSLSFPGPSYTFFDTSGGAPLLVIQVLQSQTQPQQKVLIILVVDDPSVYQANTDISLDSAVALAYVLDCDFMNQNDPCPGITAQSEDGFINFTDAGTNVGDTVAGSLTGVALGWPPPPVYCASDVDCPTGQSCDLAAGTCE